MRYAYYPGCSLQTSAKEYDLSLKAVCNRLGIELVELKDWNAAVPGTWRSDDLTPACDGGFTPLA